jgi:hypothetical protein
MIVTEFSPASDTPNILDSITPEHYTHHITFSRPHSWVGYAAVAAETKTCISSARNVRARISFARIVVLARWKWGMMIGSWSWQSVIEAWLRKISGRSGAFFGCESIDLGAWHNSISLRLHIIVVWYYYLAGFLLAYVLGLWYDMCNRKVLRRWDDAWWVFLAHTDLR